MADEIILVVLRALEVIEKGSGNSSVKFQGTETFYVKWLYSEGKLDSIFSSYSPDFDPSFWVLHTPKMGLLTTEYLSTLYNLHLVE